MKIVKSSKIGRYIQWLDSLFELSGDLTKTKSLCPLFWSVLFLTIIVPFLKIAMLLGKIGRFTIKPIRKPVDFVMNKIEGKGNKIALNVIIILVVVLLIGIGAMIHDVGLYSTMLTFGIIILVVACAIGFVWICILIIDSDNSITRFAYGMFKAIKDKTCPLIEWID